ncbi:MAG: hypothetical protein U1F77_02575 [Kiritimatiellia bacterium]
MNTSWKFITFLSMVCAGSYAAEPLVGSPYAQAQAEILRFGDRELRDIVGTGYGLGVAGNLPLAERIDGHLTVDKVWADGSSGGVKQDFETIGFQLAGVFWLPSQGICHPLGILHLDYFEVDGTSETAGEEKEGIGDNALGGGVNVGAELTLSETLWTRISGGFFHSDGEESEDIEGEIGAWVSRDLLLSTGVNYEFEGQDVIGTLYLTRRF